MKFIIALALVLVVVSCCNGAPTADGQPTMHEIINNLPAHIRSQSGRNQAHNSNHNAAGHGNGSSHKGP